MMPSHPRRGPFSTAASDPFHRGERTAQQLGGDGSSGGAIRDATPDQHRRLLATHDPAHGPFHPGELAAQQLAGGGSSGGAIRDAMPTSTAASSAPCRLSSSPPPKPSRPPSMATPAGPSPPCGPARPASSPRPMRERSASPSPSTPPTRRVALSPRAPRSASSASSSTPAGATAPTARSPPSPPPASSSPSTRASATAPSTSTPASSSVADLRRGCARRAAAPPRPGRRRRITAADTFFVATAARIDEPTGGVDISHRGGPPGFVRLSGDTLTIPDYPGNRYFNTLGNLLASPRAAVLFVDLASGDILHLQGTTEIRWDGSDVRALDGAERLWRLHVERGWRRPGALALR